jgi:hypothetical protein
VAEITEKTVNAETQRRREHRKMLPLADLITQNVRRSAGGSIPLRFSVSLCLCVPDLLCDLCSLRDLSLRT